MPLRPKATRSNRPTEAPARITVYPKDSSRTRARRSFLAPLALVFIGNLRCLWACQNRLAIVSEQRRWPVDDLSIQPEWMLRLLEAHTQFDHLGVRACRQRPRLRGLILQRSSFTLNFYGGISTVARPCKA